ncbi:MAG: hypothetical protein SVT52_05495 [Planctomycetota bacterium]|nr:hypothetical protein [Planctomycetota bacterium]
MAEMANIPLADAGDLVEVLGTVLFFVVIVIVSLIQKAKQRQAEQERLRRKKQQAAASAKFVQPASQPSTPPRPPRRTSRPVAEQLASAARRNLLLQDAPPPPVNKPTIQPELVELKPGQRPLPSADRMRQRRPAPPKQLQRKHEQPPAVRHRGLKVKKQPTIGTIGKTVTKERRPAKLAVSPPAGALTDLSNIDEARRAVIHYEIFSQPKALRADREMWEM